MDSVPWLSSRVNIVDYLGWMAVWTYCFAVLSYWMMMMMVLSFWLPMLLLVWSSNETISDVPYIDIASYIVPTVDPIPIPHNLSMLWYSCDRAGCIYCW